MIVYRLEKKDVPFLRSRLGKLLTKQAQLKKLKGRIYAVGDKSVSELEKAGIRVFSVFYDNKIMRRNTSGEIKRRIGRFGGKKVSVKNPAGTITGDLVKAAKAAVKRKTKVFVRGEEDLAAIPVMAFGKEGELVAYGLPKKGLMVVRIDGKLKKEIRKRFGI